MTTTERCGMEQILREGTLQVWPVLSWDEEAELIVSVHSSKEAAERACAYYVQVFAEGCEDGYFVGVPQTLDVVQLGPDDIERFRECVSSCSADCIDQQSVSWGEVAEIESHCEQQCRVVTMKYAGVR